jgi:hypothetical protein
VQEILKLVRKIPAGVQNSCKRHWAANRSVEVTCGALNGTFHMDNTGVCYVTYSVGGPGAGAGGSWQAHWPRCERCS